jgi:hypothetical protein
VKSKQYQRCLFKIWLCRPAIFVDQFVDVGLHNFVAYNLVFCLDMGLFLEKFNQFGQFDRTIQIPYWFVKLQFSSIFAYLKRVFVGLRAVAENSVCNSSGAVVGKVDGQVSWGYRFMV